MFSKKSTFYIFVPLLLSLLATAKKVLDLPTHDNCEINPSNYSNFTVCLLCFAEKFLRILRSLLDRDLRGGGGEQGGEP